MRGECWFSSSLISCDHDGSIPSPATKANIVQSVRALDCHSRDLSTGAILNTYFPNLRKITANIDYNVPRGSLKNVN